MINAAMFFEYMSLDIFSSLPNNRIELKMSMMGAYHVDLRLLEYFLAVVKAGNITKAAEHEPFPQKRTRNVEKKWNDMKPTRY